MEPSLTQALADILARPVDAATRRRAALHLLDWIGCAALGATAPAGRALARFGAAQPAGPAVALGAGPRDAGAAAFVNGGLGNIFELDDVHRTSIVHAGDVVIPPALAVAQRDGAAADALLDAVTRGYEAAIRVGAAAGTGHYRFWYNTATCGVFGAAAAAGSLLGLDRDRMVDALAQAGCQAAGLWQCRLEPGFSKQLEAARAAQSGLYAAELGRIGFPGPRAILEGELGFFAATSPDADPGAVVADADGPWRLFETSFKPWPACRHAHPVIEACLDLRDRLDGAGIARITEVAVETYADAVAFCDNPNPDTDHAARFSLQHCAAVTLVRGAPGFADFTPRAIADPQVAGLRAKVGVGASDAFSDAFPKCYGARVCFVLDGGTRRERTVTTAKGDPENPLGDTEIEEKARLMLAEAGVPGPAIGPVVSAVAGLADGAEPDGLWQGLAAVDRAVSVAASG